MLSPYSARVADNDVWPHEQQLDILPGWETEGEGSRALLHLLPSQLLHQGSDFGTLHPLYLFVSPHGRGPALAEGTGHTQHFQVFL